VLGSALLRSNAMGAKRVMRRQELEKGTASVQMAQYIRGQEENGKVQSMQIVQEFNLS